MLGETCLSLSLGEQAELWEHAWPQLDGWEVSPTFTPGT